MVAEVSKKTGLYDRVKELLKGYEIVELSGIQPNPKYDPSVLDGVRLCKEHNVDVILAVGGGSVLDCSKAIAAGAKYDGAPWDLISYKVKAQAALPCPAHRRYHHPCRHRLRVRLRRRYLAHGDQRQDRLSRPASVPCRFDTRPRLHFHRVEKADRRRHCRCNEPHAGTVLRG